MQSRALIPPMLTKLPPVLLAGLCHFIAAAILLALYLLLQPPEAPVLAWMLAQGLLAALSGWLIGLPLWWWPINFLFAPLAQWMLQLDIGSGWFLGAFVILVSLFWSTFQSRVPLFLTNVSTRRRLEKCVPPGARLLDLGCGFGGLLLGLARERADCEFHGCEIAPLPATIARARAAVHRRSQRVHQRVHRQVHITREDFWSKDLSRFDVVYAFLSPVPMPALWDKAKREMRAGSLLISNTFEIPGVEPDAVIAMNDYRRSSLHIWRM